MSLPAGQTYIILYTHIFHLPTSTCYLPTSTYSLIHTHTQIHAHTQYQKQPEEGGASKAPRASRTDLSHLTEKEKEDRHREQVRLNCQRKRKYALLLEAGLEQEVAQMRTHKEAIDTAPFVMVVLLPDINNCRILYVNKPVTEKLGHEVANLLGR